MTADTCAACRNYADALEAEAYCFGKDGVVAGTGWCEEFVHHSQRFCLQTVEELGPVPPAFATKEAGPCRGK